MTENARTNVGQWGIGDSEASSRSTSGPVSSRLATADRAAHRRLITSQDRILLLGAVAIRGGGPRSGPDRVIQTAQPGIDLIEASIGSTGYVCPTGQDHFPCGRPGSGLQVYEVAADCVKTRDGLLATRWRDLVAAAPDKTSTKYRNHHRCFGHQATLSAVQSSVHRTHEVSR